MKTLLRVRATGSRDGWHRTQFLEKVWTLFGVKVWSRIIDREEVPSHVVIEVCTLGWSEWKSKWFGTPGVWWKTHEGYEQR